LTTIFDLIASNSNGNNALMLAASNVHSDCIKLLIDNHCYVNISNSNGDTALTLAAEKGH
jgi:ankyrin repeat protein